MDKVRTLDELAAECRAWRAENKTIVWTNGCFDLLHAGHVRALETARALGDVLIVGLNSDASVRRLDKGGDRPLCGQDDRAATLAALEAVTRVVIFDSQRCTGEINAIKPHVWTKSGDYTPESLDPEERGAVLANGGRIVITPLVPGISTTLLVKKIRRLDPEKIVSAACVHVRDRQGRLLMVATRYTDGVKWSLPGGGHLHGESLPEAALREAREETGLEVAIDGYMGVIERIEPRISLHLALHVFRGEVDPAAIPERMAGCDEYVEEVAWFDRTRLATERQPVLGRRLWLEHDPAAWPPYIFLKPGEE